MTTAGISAGIDGSLHVVARLLGRKIADDVATYMEYSWVPEASLAMNYSYFNPSTDDRGRRSQMGDVQYASRNYGEAEKIYRAQTVEDAKDAEAWSNLGWTLRAQEKHADAAECLAKSAAAGAKDHAGYGYYNAAVEYAKAGRREDAIGALEKAFANGFTNRSAAAADPDLAKIASDPRMKQLLAQK